MKKFLVSLCLFISALGLSAQRTTLMNAGTYSAGSTYAKSDVAVAGGVYYLSLVANNVGHDPASSPTQWSAMTTGTSTFSKLGSTVAATGLIPVGIAVYWPYAYITTQGVAGAVVTLNISSGTPVVVSTYSTGACHYPNGIAYDSFGANSYLYVGCNDGKEVFVFSVANTGVLTLTTTLASGFNSPYPGASLDPTTHTFYVPDGSNGKVYPVDMSNPLSPVLKTTFQTSSNPSVAHAYAPGDGYVYIAAGAEGAPSHVQIYTTSGTLVGQVEVPHSPQRLAVRGRYIYATFYDDDSFYIIDKLNPASPVVAGHLTLGGCNPLPLAVRGVYAYLGCFPSGQVWKLDVSNAANPVVAGQLAAGGQIQDVHFAERFLLATSATTGGVVHEMDLGGAFNVDSDSVNASAEHLDAFDATVGELQVTRSLHVGGAPGYTGTRTAGACTLNVTNGIITAITGC